MVALALLGLLGTAGLCLLFTGLANLGLWLRSPEDVAVQPGLLATGAVGLIGAVCSWRYLRRQMAREKRQRLHEAPRSDEPAPPRATAASDRFAFTLLVLGGALVPVMALAILASLANSVLDSSAPTYEVVPVKDGQPGPGC